MIDFLMISTRSKKNGVMEIYPRFVINYKSTDLMIRGGDFYAIWDERRGLWSTSEQDVIEIIDEELDKYARENKDKFGGSVRVLHMWDAETGMVDSWHKFCQKQMRDNFHMLDEKLVFSNSPVNKSDYASKRLSYPLEAGDISAWDKLVGTLYNKEEREKIEWAIGSIVSGDSRFIQKFMVLYGAAGTGKSTILNIMEKLFDGYYSVFDAKALGSSSNAFALEAFKTNPLVAIQHDGDLSRIEDNTRLNSLVSHELMTVNEKFRSTYSNRFKCFLIMGTNKPVKITDGKSGLMRRLIDVSPSGNKLSTSEYKSVMKQVDFELGAIAQHCMDLYLADPGKYDDYVPMSMLGASNDFYNYILDSYDLFLREDGTTLKIAWERYNKYCTDAKVPYPLSQRAFKEELKNYFYEFKERGTSSDGSVRVRNCYSGFRKDIFEVSDDKKKEDANLAIPDWLELKEQQSIFDTECRDCLAQYATRDEVPRKKWEQVASKLSDVDTKELHYVKVPENHIVIDFDIPDEDGNKCLSKNLEAASKFPPTYAELSKGGQGIHLHYIYNGDVSRLSSIYDDHIEIKVFKGGSALRRRLSKCNHLEISALSSGLPVTKGDDKKVVNKDIMHTEKGLRTTIEKCLRKEVHAHTKSNVDFIYKVLNDAYNSDMLYDVSDMKNAVLAFAASSSHNSDYCMKLVQKMKFKSEEAPMGSTDEETPIVFYDIEVFPNLFLVNAKARGKDKQMMRFINPTPEQIEDLLKFRLVGFNCRRYDNHIMYARMMGYTNIELFKLSQQIINGNRNAMFGNAYDLSYTDVYDFASAGNKKSLKKLEIEMSTKANDPNSKMSNELRELLLTIKHHELGLPWDQPVPEELWPKVAEYCDDVVLATEAAFEYLSADWTARQILADLAEMNVNSSTNSLTTRIIFGGNKNPQNEFCYRDLSEPVSELDPEVKEFLENACPKMMEYPHYGWMYADKQEVPFESASLLPYFPGYTYERGVSTYRGEEVGEGGYVYAEPGIHCNVALLDIASMHPHSTIAECLFGVRYTTAYRDIVEGRVSIKHEAWDEINNMLDGKLTPYIQKVIDGAMTSGDLANALKTAINSVYGLTSAKFENPFKHPDNIDNIVAKRGALFMVDLKHAVQEQGFTVAHIKTDSIKIPDATPEIIQFVMDFGERYGYTFEHEATYDRMCLVNDAVYIAKYKDGKHAGEWTATGKQFAVPYLFKKLFSKEEITIYDMCETFQVQTSLYLDMNEELPEGEHDYRFVGKVGQFCPIKSGCGGGELLRDGVDKDGNQKFSSATGAKGYRWLESEIIKTNNAVDMIDKTYYENMVHDAIAVITKYAAEAWFEECSFDWFVSDAPYKPPCFENGKPIYEELPWN